MCTLSHLQLFVTPWPVAPQAPLSMGFSRQQYWSGLPCLPQGDLLHCQADAFQCATWEATVVLISISSEISVKSV